MKEQKRKQQTMTHRIDLCFDTESNTTKLKRKTSVPIVDGVLSAKEIAVALIACARTTIVEFPVIAFQDTDGFICDITETMQFSLQSATRFTVRLLRGDTPQFVGRLLKEKQVKDSITIQSVTLKLTSVSRAAASYLANNEVPDKSQLAKAFKRYTCSLIGQDNIARPNMSKKYPFNEQQDLQVSLLADNVAVEEVLVSSETVFHVVLEEGSSNSAGDSKKVHLIFNFFRYYADLEFNLLNPLGSEELAQESALFQQIYSECIEQYTRPISKSDRIIPGFLVVGHSGTGKSYIAKKIIEVNHMRKLIDGTASSLNRKYVGEAEGELKVIIDSASQYPYVLHYVYLDEIHTLVQSQVSQGTVEHKKDILTILLDYISMNLKNICFIFCTNHHNRIDEAFTRNGRIDRQYMVLPPNFHERRTIVLEKQVWSKELMKDLIILIVTCNFTIAQLNDIEIRLRNKNESFAVIMEAIRKIQLTSKLTKHTYFQYATYGVTEEAEVTDRLFNDRIETLICNQMEDAYRYLFAFHKTNVRKVQSLIWIDSHFLADHKNHLLESLFGIYDICEKSVASSATDIAIIVLDMNMIGVIRSVDGYTFGHTNGITHSADVSNGLSNQVTHSINKSYAVTDGVFNSTTDTKTKGTSTNYSVTAGLSSLSGSFGQGTSTTHSVSNTTGSNHSVTKQTGMGVQTSEASSVQIRKGIATSDSVSGTHSFQYQNVSVQEQHILQEFVRTKILPTRNQVYCLFVYTTPLDLAVPLFCRKD